MLLKQQTKEACEIGNPENESIFYSNVPPVFDNFDMDAPSLLTTFVNAQETFRFRKIATFVVFLKKEIMKTIEALPQQINSDKDAFDVIAFIDKGIVYSSFEKIHKELPFTLEQWALFLDTSTRTLQRWKKSGIALPALCADRIIEIYQLYKFGIEVFGRESFNKWLNSNIATLDGKTPVSFLNNSQGINLIRTKLGRIQHGVLA